MKTTRVWWTYYDLVRINARKERAIMYHIIQTIIGYQLKFFIVYTLRTNLKM